MDWSHTPLIEPMDTSPELPVAPTSRFPAPLRMVLLLALILLLIGGCLLASLWYYRSQQQALIDEHTVSLQSIAQLTSNQLLAWRKERLADARMNASGMVRHLALQWLHSGRTDLLEDIRQRLAFFRDNEGYYNMVLADPAGRIHLSLVPRITQVEPEEQVLVDQVLARKSAVLGDFFHCHNCNRMHISVAAPVFDGQEVALVLLLVADPNHDLYPMIASWPIPHSNGESILLRREGTDVVALHHLRHLALPPLAYRQPITIDNVLSQAATGRTGQLRGPDYRGVEVLADAHPIVDTPWVMVSKIDFAEITATARLRTTVLVVLLAMAMIIAGTLVRLFGMSRHKRLSVALLAEERGHRQTRERIRATLYSIGEGVIATDAEGKITGMNPAAEVLTGWREEQTLGLPLQEVYQVIDEATGETVASTGQQALLTGSIVQENSHRLLRAQDGTTHPIADIAAPIRAGGNTLDGVVLVVRDQSKRRAMERARAESAQRFTDLVESVSDFIWETGKDHRFTFANCRILDMLGFYPHECHQFTWMDLLDQPQQAKDFAETIANLRPYSQICLQCRRQDGGVVILESSGTPIVDAQGNFSGYRGISRDITQRKRSEEEQRSLQAQLRQSQKMEVIGRLAGGVAHDFNNMLTVISSYVEMMLTELDEHHPFYRRLNEVYKASRHSTDLTRQLLTFARKQAVTPQVIDLNATISRALKMLQRLIGEHIRLQWEPAPDLWQVRADTTQIGQILANLAVNARDAMAETGNLHIRTANVTLAQEQGTLLLGLVPGDYVSLSVQDNGCGMSREIQEQIFEPFFTTKEEGRGTGLGLATVYGIVKQHEGGIQVQSAPEAGTTFTLFLPRAATGLSQSSVDETPHKPLGTETIVLVEDESAILELATYILEQQGYTVLAAESPVGALQIIEQYSQRIDLLITDIIMPEMNGRVLAQKVVAQRPNIKVLFMSGYTGDILAHHGEGGIDLHFIEKPFTSSQLSSRIRAVFDQPPPGLHTDLNGL